MTANTQVKVSGNGKLDAVTESKVALGHAFINALKAKDFDGLERLFSADVRFRAMVPGEEMSANTAQETAAMLQDWFGGSDVLQVLQSAAMPMADRLYLMYRLRVHSASDGWQVIEQHAYCKVGGDRIAEMWLLCSGFRADPDRPTETVDSLQSPWPRLNGDDFYNAGSKGCADGPLDEIAGRMRRLDPGQTLEIYATEPSVASDLPVWCRLSGHQFVRRDGNSFLIRHQ